MKGCVIMATIGFEEELWASADKLRNNMDEDYNFPEESDFCLNFTDIKIKLKKEISKIKKLETSKEVKEIVNNIDKILD